MCPMPHIVASPTRRIVKNVVEGPPLSLVEAVAERIAASVLASHPLVQHVSVAVKKTHVAVLGVVESLGAGARRGIVAGCCYCALAPPI